MGKSGKSRKSPKKAVLNQMKELSNQLDLTAPQLMEMIQQQAITNMQLKSLNDAMIQEILQGFDILTERLCVLEDKVLGENKGVFELASALIDQIRLNAEQAAELRAKITKANETNETKH